MALDPAARNALITEVDKQSGQLISDLYEKIEALEAALGDPWPDEVVNRAADGRTINTYKKVDA